jgi:hypothetical protein
MGMRKPSIVTDVVIILVGIALAINLLQYVLLTYQLKTVTKMVDMIGDIQHMQIFHPEELFSDPCFAHDEVEQQDNNQNHTFKAWDEGE